MGEVGASPERPVGMNRLEVRESATPVRRVLHKPRKVPSVDSYERYDRTSIRCQTCSYSGFTDCTMYRDRALNRHGTVVN